MRASSAPLEGNRVRLSVELDEEELDGAIQETYRRLAQQIRVPGFRPGRVPRPILEARLGGAAAVRRQAISDAMPDFYARAVAETEIDPIAAPEIDVTAGEERGPVAFDVLVDVRPSVTVPGYAGLQVTIPSLAVTTEEVDRHLERMREQTGELREADRPATDGDHVTLDVHGSGEGRKDLDVEDFLYEVGSGSALPGLDGQVRGSKVGDILQFETSLPTPDGGSEPAQIRVLVKEVKEKVLPPLTDAWAADASEFETVEALRSDLEDRLGRMKLVSAQLAFRQRAAEALAALVEDEPPEALVEAEVRERLHDLGHRLESRGMGFAQFLEVSGRDEESLLGELREEANRAVLLDLALRSLAEAEGLEVTESELDETLKEMAEEAGGTAAELRERLVAGGRLAAVRSSRRKAKAMSWLLEHVEVVDEEGQPVARDLLQVDQAGDDLGGSKASGRGDAGGSEVRSRDEAPDGGGAETEVAETEVAASGDPETR